MLQILCSSVRVKLLARAKLIFLREQPDDFFFCGEPWTIPKGWGLVPAWKVRDHRFVSCFSIPSFKEQNVSSPLNRKDWILQPTWPKDNVLGRRPTGLNFKSCVWRAVSPHSYHHLQEVLLAQFSLYVNKCGVKPHSFHFITFHKAN